MLIFSLINMKIKFDFDKLSNASKELKKHINKKIILICGEMGAGKTTLIKDLLIHMNVTDNVTSPTFSIINEYKTINKEIVYHMDLFRIKEVNELYNIGFFEYLESGKTCIIEWGEIFEEIIESDYNKFTITKQDNFRLLIKNR